MMDEERRRRGRELQAGLPEPSRRAARWMTRKPSERREVADGIVELAVEFGGLWGLLVAVPLAVLWLWRRLRRWAGGVGGAL